MLRVQLIPFEGFAVFLTELHRQMPHVVVVLEDHLRVRLVLEKVVTEHAFPHGIIVLALRFIATHVYRIVPAIDLKIYLFIHAEVLRQ